MIRLVAAVALPLMAMLLVGCSGDAGKVSAGQAILLRQVASDIQVALDPQIVAVRDDGGEFYYVCGLATLNRPGTGPLALNNERQRYIVTVNRSRGVGGALFDGSREANREFVEQWLAKCPPGFNGFNPPR